jgi:hypothetical protein
MVRGQNDRCLVPGPPLFEPTPQGADGLVHELEIAEGTGVEPTFGRRGETRGMGNGEVDDDKFVHRVGGFLQEAIQEACVQVPQVRDLPVLEQALEAWE